MGKTDIVEEYVEQKTPRSKQWRNDMIKNLRPQDDEAAFASRELVRLTIDNYPPTSTDPQTGKKFSPVGGKISLVKLSGKGIHWIEPGACQK